MGSGDHTKHSRPTAKFDASELVRLTRADIVTVPLEEVGEDPDDPLREWDDELQFPAGSQPEVLPATSRTATLADPLTTGLLAEVSRRSHTLEVHAPGPARAANPSGYSPNGSPVPSRGAGASREAARGPEGTWHMENEDALPASLEEALRAFSTR